MKRQILVLVAAVALSSGVCFAQSEKKGRPDGSQRIEMMSKELGLNESQAAQLKTLFENSKPQRVEGQERPSREEMDKQRKEMDSKIKSILTEEQYKKFEEMKSQKGPKGDKKDKKDKKDGKCKSTCSCDSNE